MRNRIAIIVGCLLAAAPLRGADSIDYARQIKPILREHCYECHGADERESGLRLDTAKAAISGGNSGAGIVPGNSAASMLIEAISGAKGVVRMPPADDYDPLSAAQIKLLRTWIDQGAKYPSDERAEVSENKKEKHWAFRPVVRYIPPTVRQSDWTNNAIDAFILVRLEAKSIKPSPQADRITLLRRVTFDLAGLPPTPADVRSFLADDRPDAYERAVDRLLASPQFAERWARHWLDLARYADSNGYTNDNPRSIWRYRDWVIDAVSANMPFDQFTIEQIAGDMLPSATVDQQIATGFHRNTQLNQEGGSDAEEYRVEAVVDRVNTTGAVYLGLTVGCARCHDHKFDDFSQRDFYQLFAFLNNQDEPNIKVPVGRGNPATVSTMVMRERTTPRVTKIHLRGNFLTQGRVVQANVPAALPPLPSSDGKANRLDLARWLVSADNPLTPRVTVNRLWQQYFGRGIVETENDFGTQGSPPSHPELLDWLASELVRTGWNMKAMHRLIVTSATYRQSSRVRADLAEVDPDNRLLARQSRLRLEAEAIRDAALAASGLLTERLGGPGVYPPQPAGVMKLTRNPNRKWKVSQGADRYRRAMYTYFWRSTPHPFLKLFNAPESNTTCTRRERSNTPLQSLTLLNDETFFEAAQALAIRVLGEAKSATDAARIDLAFRLCFSRPPSKRERAIVLELLDAERGDPAGIEKQWKTPALGRMPPGMKPAEVMAWTSVARALLNTDEFITRE
ncbi:MAG: PSD1 domain-containing protein [Planctomycetes bacterium]|nr:PSD1 domain-containing protein [Planctomycetota bacterium]